VKKFLLVALVDFEEDLKDFSLDIGSFGYYFFQFIRIK